MAESYGFESADLLNRLPELGTVLTEGLPPVHYSQALSAAAATHTRDMIELLERAYALPAGAEHGQLAEE